MIIAFTGHRPPKAGLTYSHQAPSDLLAVDAVRSLVAELQPAFVIVGGALGFDTLAARAAWLESIPFQVFVPFPGQEKKWPRPAQTRYLKMLQAAQEVRYITKGEYSPQAMQVRNMAMVNACDLLAAWWDGSPGGTRNCLDYASLQHTTTRNLYEKEIAHVR